MKKILNNLEEIVAGIFICITVSSVIMNVMLRTFGGSPISSAEEIATTSFIWSIYIGGAACFKKKMHIGVDMLVQLLPKKMQRIFMVLVNIFVTVLTGVLFYLSIIFTKYSVSKPTSVLGISSAYVNSALIVGFGLILFHSIGFTIKAIRDINKEGDK
ncbi:MULTISPECIES: TRAP transporter small permease [Fusobacterium]|uniref:TRAP transporter small permease n=1 Tax=Fusobacterium TaxID=848 RepID=UPI0014777236|nr:MULTISPECIES: TRAP transporter small permease [Fusobacterium]NME35852.1 TRAP transporter small permease [Fusobacterium sp. FSA-380-WT-3A]